ncbi:hypothetical protein HK096_004015 [Nowakowskiella sp. JEL0078]|nr:hypothetical protein HK096_004015 [Nowakowskiella sp. JEL0078]
MRFNQNSFDYDDFYSLHQKASRILNHAYSEFYDQGSPQNPVSLGNNEPYRKWKTDSWRMPVPLPMKDTQNLVFLNIKLERLEVHKVAQQGTTCPESYIAISHVWNQEMNDSKCDGQPRIDRIAWALAAAQKLAVEYIENGYPDFTPYNYMWIDLLSVDQNSPDAVRAATYSMSNAYTWADTTLVLMQDETLISKSMWFDRVWTLQESFFCHYLAFYHQGKCYIINDLGTDLPYAMFDKRWIRLRTGIFEARDIFSIVNDRKCYRGLDTVYAVTGMLPYLGDIKATYDLTIDQLKMRVAKRALEHGDTSLTHISNESDSSNNVVMSCIGGFSVQNNNGGSLNATEFDETQGTTVFFVSEKNLMKQKFNRVKWGYKLGGCEENHLQQVLTRCEGFHDHNLKYVLMALCDEITDDMLEKKTGEQLIQMLHDANSRMKEYNLVTRTTEAMILNHHLKYLTASSAQDLAIVLNRDLTFLLYSTSSKDGFDTYLGLHSEEISEMKISFGLAAYDFGTLFKIEHIVGTRILPIDGRSVKPAVSMVLRVPHSLYKEANELFVDIPIEKNRLGRESSFCDVE